MSYLQFLNQSVEEQFSLNLIWSKLTMKMSLIKHNATVLTHIMLICAKKKSINLMHFMCIKEVYGL